MGGPWPRGMVVMEGGGEGAEWGWRMGHAGYGRRKGDDLAGAGWERFSAVTEMEKRWCVGSGVQGAWV